jgi:hypothetical protein
MKYHQVIRWAGKFRADNYAGSSVVISLDDLVPVRGPQEFFSAANDIRKELTEEINKEFSVVEKDGVSANAFISAPLGPEVSDETGEFSSRYIIQFYYFETVDKV